MYHLTFFLNLQISLIIEYFLKLRIINCNIRSCIALFEYYLKETKLQFIFQIEISSGEKLKYISGYTNFNC